MDVTCAELLLLMLCHLSEPGDLGQVLRVLHDAGLAAKWRAIGKTLTVSDADLAGFDARFSGDPSLCLLHMVTSWLRGQKRLLDPPSWRRLVWAVADPQGGGTVHGGKRIAAMLRGVSGCSRVLSLPLIPILTLLVKIAAVDSYLEHSQLIIFMYDYVIIPIAQMYSHVM